MEITLKTAEQAAEEITAEQYTALRKLAVRYGRNWKSSLRQMWLDGNYGQMSDSHLLQQIRNTFGPAWLARFRFKN